MNDVGKRNFDWGKFIAARDAEIRSGRIADARLQLANMPRASVPRPFAEPLAHLYYRVRKFFRCLEILAPIVRAEDRRVQATPLEKATYAIALIKLGSIHEGMELLRGSSEQVAIADLYTAFGYQAMWDYENALPHLRRYAGAPGVGEYEQAIARVNLLAALIYTSGFDEARRLASELVAQARAQQWTLLYKNLKELTAELCIAEGDWSGARAVLKEAAHERYYDKSIFDFFLAKAMAIVDVKSAPSGSAIARLREIRGEALQLAHWESVRECDRVLATATRDRELFLQVYFGTPYAAFRKMQRNDWPGLEIPGEFIFGDNRGTIVDLVTAESTPRALELKFGQLLHLGLRALASDQYRPLYVGELHAVLFEGAYFNPHSSPGRVANVIKRLRGWAGEHELPIEFSVDKQLHGMRLTGQGFGFRQSVGANDLNLEQSELELARLKRTLARDEFSAAQVAEILKISKSSALRVVNKALAAGALEAHGHNRDTKYRFAA